MFQRGKKICFVLCMAASRCLYIGQMGYNPALIESSREHLIPFLSQQDVVLDTQIYRRARLDRKKELQILEYRFSPTRTLFAGPVGRLMLNGPLAGY